MKKKITKEEFIKQKGELAYDAMTDFLNLEIDDDFIEVMYAFVSVANFRAGEYEGNQYLLKKLNAQELVIINISGEGFVEEEKLFRFNISVAEFLYILDEIDEWRKDFWKN